MRARERTSVRACERANVRGCEGSKVQTWQVSEPRARQWAGRIKFVKSLVHAKMVFLSHMLHTLPHPPVPVIQSLLQATPFL